MTDIRSGVYNGIGYTRVRPFAMILGEQLRGEVRIDVSPLSRDPEFDWAAFHRWVDECVLTHMEKGAELHVRMV